MLVVPNQGEQILLEAAIGKTPATAWTLRLFVNNHTPGATDTEANYAEAAGGGYAGIALTAGSWSVVKGAPSIGSYPEQMFTFTGALDGGASVYGYHVTNAGGQLLFAERFQSPFTPANPGDTVAITPQISCASGD